MELREELKEELVKAAGRFETAGFIKGDPVQFPHRYCDRHDVEVSAFVSAWMAYGSRRVFLQVLEKLHAMMDSTGGPYRYITGGFWKNIGEKDKCLYRFYKWGDFVMLCSRMASAYSEMDSLECLFEKGKTLDDGVLALCRRFEGVEGIPVPGSTSANKRFYMFLRWMVRCGSPVDFGIWNTVSPSELVIPLDTHVYQVARQLGLTARKSADLKTAREITAALAAVWPDDPARGDFALYGSQVMD